MTEQTKNKNGCFEYKTAIGVLEWRGVLEPRKSSGFVGELTINSQWTASETLELKNSIKSDAVTKQDLEIDILKFCGVTRAKPTAKADNNDKISVAVLKALKSGTTAEQIAVNMRTQKFSEVDILKYLPELKTPKTLSFA